MIIQWSSNDHALQNCRTALLQQHCTAWSCTLHALYTCLSYFSYLSYFYTSWSRLAEACFHCSSHICTSQKVIRSWLTSSLSNDQVARWHRCLWDNQDTLSTASGWCTYLAKVHWVLAFGSLILQLFQVCSANHEPRESERNITKPYNTLHHTTTHQQYINNTLTIHYNRLQSHMKPHHETSLNMM